MTLSTLDMTIFVVYILGLLFVAYWVSREEKGHQKNTNEYFLAGNSLPWWAIGASLIAANISLAGFQVGLADSIYTTFTNYGGDVANDDVIKFGLKETNQISYTYQAGDLKAILDAELAK